MENLSKDVLCYMLDYVDLNDIIQFSKTSKYYKYIPYIRYDSVIFIPQTALAVRGSCVV